VGIVNVRTRKLELLLREHDQAYQIRAVAYNCYDTLLASASSDGELIVNALSPNQATQEQTAVKIFRDM